MSINTQSGRDTTRLRAATAARLTSIRAQRFIVQNDPGPLTALDDVLAYMNECDQVGITPHSADVLSLVAAALGVSS